MNNKLSARESIKLGMFLAAIVIGTFGLSLNAVPIYLPLLQLIFCSVALTLFVEDLFAPKKTDKQSIYNFIFSVLIGTVGFTVVYTLV